MQKLRDLYAETQNNAKKNFDKVTLQRCKKIQAYVNREFQKTNPENDYDNFLEITFYQEKYKLIIDKFNSAINEKTKKSKLQADIINIVAENFRPTAEQHTTPQPFVPSPQSHSSPTSPPPKKTEPTTKDKLKKDRNSKEQQQKLPENTSEPKDMIASYFQMKKTEIQRSKIGFKSVLQNIPKASQKYAVRSNIKVKEAKQANDENIVKLTKQINELNLNLEQSKVSSQFNHGLIELQRHKYEERLGDLRQQLQKLYRQNQKLKQEQHILMSSRPNQKQTPPVHIIEHVFIPQRVQQGSFYDPHNISYKSNDLLQLNNKYHGKPPNGHNHRYNQYPQYEIKANKEKITHRASQQELIEKIFPQKQFKDPVKYQSEFQKSNLRVNKSQLENEEKNIIIRSKVSFFKSSMVLFRGQQFELAIKSYDIVPLESRRVTIYINNKDRFQRKISISYFCDPGYYEIKTLKKLVSVEGLKQGRQEIEIKLKSQGDLDSLIEAKLQINNKTLKFLIPTMMIQFLPVRPLNSKRLQTERHIVRPLMYQFSNIHSAMELIPLDKGYEDRVEVGSVYARSKYFQGNIILRWKSRQQLQIQTIKPWMLFLSYLMTKYY